MKKILVLLVLALLLMTSWLIGSGELKKEIGMLSPEQQSGFVLQDTVAAKILEIACLDCHSNSTSYPFYASFYPVSSYVTGHINHGKGEFNLDLWESWSSGEKIVQSRRLIRYVKDKSMPLTSYTLLHRDAKLSDSQRASLIRCFQELIEENKALLLSNKFSGHSVSIATIAADTILSFPHNTGYSQSSIQLYSSSLLYVKKDDEKGTGKQILYLKESEGGEEYPVSQEFQLIYQPLMFSDQSGFMYCAREGDTYYLIYKDLSSFESIILATSSDSIEDYRIQLSQPPNS